MDEINLLKKMTIVMPTYEREAFALRNMHFWSGKQIQFLVLDGSKQKISDQKLEEFEDNIKYFHLPVSMAERINFAKELVNTEYVSLLGDDEFLLPSGIAACINEIEKKDLATCLGRSLYFSYKEGKIEAEPLNHEAGSPWHPGFKNYNLLQNDPAERVRNHMNPYLSTTFYAVTKTPVWKRSMAAYQNMRSSADCPEVALELSNSFQGKSKVIDILMWLRSGENEPMLLYGERKDYITFGKWYDDPVYENEKHLFISTIVDAVHSSSSKYQKNYIYKVIRSGCQAFSLFEKTRRFDLRAWIVNMHLGFKPMKYLIIKRFNQLMQKIGFRKSDEHGLSIIDPDLFEMASVWNKNGIGVDLEEIREINELIINFHKQSEKA